MFVFDARYVPSWWLYTIFFQRCIWPLTAPKSTAPKKGASTKRVRCPTEGLRSLTQVSRMTTGRQCCTVCPVRSLWLALLFGCTVVHDYMRREGVAGERGKCRGIRATGMCIRAKVIQSHWRLMSICIFNNHGTECEQPLQYCTLYFHLPINSFNCIPKRTRPSIVVSLFFKAIGSVGTLPRPRLQLQCIGDWAKFIQLMTAPKNYCPR